MTKRLVWSTCLLALAISSAAPAGALTRRYPGAVCQPMGANDNDFSPGAGPIYSVGPLYCPLVQSAAATSLTATMYLNSAANCTLYAVTVTGSSTSVTTVDSDSITPSAAGAYTFPAVTAGKYAFISCNGTGISAISVVE